jgi:hypothetical protein
VHDDQLTVGDRVMDLELQIGVRGAQPERSGHESGRSPPAAARRLVFRLTVGRLRMDDPGQFGEIAGRHDRHGPDAAFGIEGTHAISQDSSDTVK